MTLVTVDASRSSTPYRVGVPAPAHYRGPHGPFDGVFGVDSTEMKGAAAWEGWVPWGSALAVSENGGSGRAEGRVARRLLRQGLELRVGPHRGVVRQPGQGLTRWGRAVHVEVADATWRWRHRRLDTLRFEGPGDTTVAESRGARRSLAVDDDAAPLDVALAVLTWFASLDGICHGERLGL